MPVMGHITWAGYQYSFQNNVLCYVHPTRGHAFSFQSSGGQIWSGEDWYENDAGLLLTETTLADTTYKPGEPPSSRGDHRAAQSGVAVRERDRRGAPLTGRRASTTPR
jgi:hypothetical protein